MQRLSIFQNELRSLTNVDIKKERWMTDELLEQVLKKNNMYIDCKTTRNTHTDYEKVKLNFKGYEKNVSKCIEKDKKYIMIEFL